MQSPFQGGRFSSDPAALTFFSKDSKIRVPFRTHFSGAFPEVIATGADGTLYVTEQNLNKIAQVTLTGTVTQINPPTANSGPFAIWGGEDGNVWFTEFNANKIARIGLPKNPKQSNEFPIPTASSSPAAIAAGPDGSLYFVERAANNIGKITATGYITEFTVPTANAFRTDYTDGISVGNDGFLYFIEDNTDRVARIRTDFNPGTFTEVQLASGAAPTGIKVASDGNVYFCEFSASKLGRLPLGFGSSAVPVEVSIPGGTGFLVPAPDHNIYFTEYTANKVGYIPMGFTSTTPYVESASTAGSQPALLTVDKSGNIWFTEIGTAKVAEIGKGFAAGTAPKEFSLPAGSLPNGITLGSDGALYVAEIGGEVARVTTAGAISQIKTLTASSKPWDIAAGADGNIWFTEEGANNIGKILLRAPAFNTLSAVQLIPAGGGQAPVSLGPALVTGFLNDDSSLGTQSLTGSTLGGSGRIAWEDQRWIEQYVAELFEQASLPEKFTFLSADADVESFSAILNTTGTESLTVGDTLTPSITGTDPAIQVT